MTAVAGEVGAFEEVAVLARFAVVAAGFVGQTASAVVAVVELEWC